MKYIVFQKDKVKTPIIFAESLTHLHMAEMLMEGPLAGWAAVSAGFYSPLDGNCYGESVSLKLRCDPRDAAMIREHDYTMGVEAA